MSIGQLNNFLKFVQTVSPWFPYWLILDVENLDTVGKNIKNLCTEKGGKDMTLRAFSTCSRLA